jgi:hypothetical protein
MEWTEGIFPNDPIIIMQKVRWDVTFAENLIRLLNYYRGGLFKSCLIDGCI